jgi:hypothetical protein
MQNSNLTAQAALRNLRGKINADLRTSAKPSTTQSNNLLALPDHFIVIGPETEKISSSNDELDVPATIHR